MKKIDYLSDDNCLIDTSILLIANIDVADKDQQRITQALIDKLSLTGKGCLSIQNYVEFVNVVTRKTNASISELNKVLSYFRDLFKTLHYCENEVFDAVGLCQKYKLHFFDALLAQAMLYNNIRVIYTENDKDFNKIPGIKAINPFKRIRKVNLGKLSSPKKISSLKSNK